MGFYSDFAGHYEKIFPFRPPTFAFLDRWLPASGRILDIGCGTGSYCGALAATDRTCLGVDLDRQMVQAARAMNSGAEFRELAMERIDRLPAGGFAGVFCIGNVLPHLEDDDLPGFLRTVHRSLRPGGVWIFQTVNFDRLGDRSEFDFPRLEVPADKLVFERIYRDITPRSLRFVTRLTEAGGELFSGETALYPLTVAEAMDLHRAGGFALRGHFADFTESAFDPARSGGSVYVFERVGT